MQNRHGKAVFTLLDECVKRLPYNKIGVNFIRTFFLHRLSHKMSDGWCNVAVVDWSDNEMIVSLIAGSGKNVFE